MHIAVDGYNFIKQSPCLRALERVDLQKAREKLIEILAEYKRYKGHAITVVFDGAGQLGKGIYQELQRGIAIIFSKAGEKADDVLKRLAEEKKKGIVIVTSDREIAYFVEKKGATPVSIEEFNTRIEMARLYSIKGELAEKDSGPRHLAPQKKGPAHRPPKNKRRAELSFKKL